MMIEIRINVGRIDRIIRFGKFTIFVEDEGRLLFQ